MTLRRRAIGLVTLTVMAGCSSDGGAGASDSQTATFEVVVPTTPSTTSTTSTTTTTTVQPTATTVIAATTVAPVPSSTAPSTAAATTTTTATGPGSTESPHTGSTTSCSGGALLEDTDGDGWGECAAIPPLDPLTIIWWHRIGAFRQASCDGGFDAANEASLVPGGLDPVTYDFFCATLAAEQPPDSEPAPGTSAAP